MLAIYLYILARDTLGERVTKEHFDRQGVMLMLITLGRILALGMTMGAMVAQKIPRWKQNEIFQKGRCGGMFQCCPSTHSNRALRVAFIVIADFGMRVLPIVMWLALRGEITHDNPYEIPLPWRSYYPGSKLELAIWVG